MKSRKEKLWLTTFLIVGCGSRLQVDPGVGGATGTAGSGLGGTDIGLVDPPLQGGLEQPCITGGTEPEAAGSVAQADVNRLDRCNDGLMCGPDKRCLVIPDCPQPNGICVMRHPEPTGGGGASGSGGNSGGYGGDITSTAGSSATAAVPEPAVVALAADDSRLYWAEYGSRDALGNYQNDGALKASDFGGGTVATVAGNLPGPIDVKLTQTQAYVSVDGAPLIGSQTHRQLFRVPLSGGSPALVQVDISVYSLVAANDDSAFFIKENEKPAGFVGTFDSSIYRWSAADATLTPLVTNASYCCAAIDATDLFYGDSGTGTTWRVPLGGGEPTPVGLTGNPIALRGDSIYWIETLDNDVGILLDRLPKSGGASQRIRGLGAGASRDFQVAGDRFFWRSGYVGEQSLGILTASFTSAAPPVHLLDVAAAVGSRLRWVGTPSAFYWTDGYTIYARSLADLP